MNYIRAKVSESGRLSLPAEFRRGQLDLNEAVTLSWNWTVVICGSGRLMKSLTALKKSSDKHLAGRHDVTVDDFLAERRREAAKE